MTPLMSEAFLIANEESFDNAAFDKIVNSRDYQPERWLAEGLAEGSQHIGKGIAWFGFWIFLAVCAYSGLLGAIK